MDLLDIERRKKEEAERKAKLDEIAQRQRQREKELHEKEQYWRDQVIGRAVPPAPAPERGDRAVPRPAPARDGDDH